MRFIVHVTSVHDKRRHMHVPGSDMAQQPGRASYTITCTPPAMLSLPPSSGLVADMVQPSVLRRAKSSFRRREQMAVDRKDELDMAANGWFHTEDFMMHRVMTTSRFWSGVWQHVAFPDVRAQ